MTHLEYRKGGHIAKPLVLQTDGGKFQGMVVFMPASSEDGEPERLCVPTTSTSYSTALDEAKALAHKVLSDL